jgi:hypothetical protein
LLGFDAHAQLSLADDLLMAAVATEDPTQRDALWAEHDLVALRASRLAPWLPAGPMMLARGLALRQQWAAALPAYHEAVKRSCCSRRLHEERLGVARVLGQLDVAAQDEAWLRAQHFPVP